MQVHLDNAATNGYPIAGFWVSDSSIYGRFGYGAATYGQTVNFDGTRVGLRKGVAIDELHRIFRTASAPWCNQVF